MQIPSPVEGGGAAPHTHSSRQEKAIFLIRLIVGAVFLTEGVQKFLFPDSLGVGRFITIGIPAPEIMAPFVGVVETVCGSLILVGLVTRLASVPLIIDILVAIMTTKVPILLAKGFWPMIHEARTDWSMLLGSVFLLLTGAGSWSLDQVRAKRRLGGTSGVPHSPLVQRDLRPGRNKDAAVLS